MRASEKSRRLTGLALMTAIVVVLQLVASMFVRVGIVAPTLALAPIIIGAALYGVSAGAWLGAVFGIVVFLACVAGWDGGGNVLFTANPFLTFALCIVKGAAAGLVAGAVYRALEHRSPMGASLVSGIICPVVNTGIFCGALALFYHDTLVAWAGGTNLVFYVITGLVGLNFLLELVINLALSTVIVRVVSARKHA